MRRSNKWIWIGLIVGAVGVFAVIHNFILTHFYISGAYFFDSGWFAHTAWRSDWPLQAPDGHPWGEFSYLRQHMALWFVPLTWLSQIAPGGPADFMAWWFAAIYVAAFFVGFIVLARVVQGLGLRSGVAAFVSLVGALAFTFNGMAVETLLYPHPEVLVSLGVIAVLAAGVAKAWRWAAGFAAITLLVRTDAGFHIAVFSAAVAGAALAGPVLQDWRSRRLGVAAVRTVLAKEHAVSIALLGAGAALIASIALYAVQSTAIPGGTQFRDIYSGDPFFAHVTLARLADRIGVMITDRMYIWPGVFACLAAFAVTRSAIFLFGALAIIPWTLINAAAISGAASTLFSYYAFPFIVTLAWPLIFAPMVTDVARRRWVTALGLSAALASSWLGFAQTNAWNRVVDGARLAGTPQMVGATRAAAPRVAYRFGGDTVLYDHAMLALTAHLLPSRATFEPNRPYEDRAIDAVIYIHPFIARDPVNAFADERALSADCRLPATPIAARAEAGFVAALEAGGFVCR